MKRFFIFMTGLIISLVSFADPIPLSLCGGPPDEHGGKGHREQPLLPSVDYADREVTISVPYQIDDMEVTIRDNQGDVLYSTVIPVIYLQYSIVLPDYVDAAKYSIQIAYGDIHLIGWF
ncbi:MAG: DUF3244 domain-containing protein [Bacteroidaceae bacterium]|nr:DUF3244 domain-containing protein [Bacteroidaceae bacterium]